MTHPLTSSVLTPERDVLEPEDVQLIEKLRSIWQDHQAKGIEIRHRIGRLLNERLGPPGTRQKYAQAVIKDVAEKLNTDETNISRFRRFAERFPTYSGFHEEYPQLNSWTRVREMLNQPRKSVSGHRRAWGLVRSLQAAVESLSLKEPLASPRAIEVSRLLGELFVAAQARTDIKLPAGNKQMTDDPQFVTELSVV